MTPDPFTEAAREEAEALFPDDPALQSSTPHNVAMSSARAGLVRGAEWARDHLAAQETDGGRAVRELHEPILAYRLIDGEDFAQEPDGDVCVVCREYYPCDTIQALDAARAARRDEEPR